MAKRPAPAKRPAAPARPAGAPPAAVAIEGDDEFLKRETLTDLRHRLLGEQAAAGGVVEFDGRTAALAEVFDTLRTPALFSERSLVIVHDADPFVSRHRDALESYVEQPADRSVLVLVLASLPGNQRLHKAIRKVGQVISCKAVKYGKVTQWVIDFAARRCRKRIDWATAELLRDAVGDETGVLAGEIEKLSIYVGDRNRIAREDVEALSADSRISAVFELTDAMGRRDAGAALTVAESLFEADRSAGFRLVGFLAKQVRKLWEGRRLYDQGCAPADICRTVGVTYFADRFIEQVRRFAEPKLAAGFDELLQVDMAIKTGTEEPRQAFERFLVQMCR